MKLKIFITILFVAAIGFVAFSANRTEHFAPAEDFPREALVYVQINDLPRLINLWNESKFKEKYSESTNFYQFKSSHLGRKLVSRLNEFSTASGFSIDLETVSSLTANRAALAIYDIGKLEFVFIAPVSDEIFAATKFVQNQDKFAEETLSDGTKIYRAAVEADRGRQKQELIFTHAKGRFILATSEKLLAQTLENISGNGRKNRLSDEPSFALLSEKTEPHSATVWVNQTRLNADYYFKRYWLMSDAEDLQNIRAGIFDFEIQAEKLVEQRRFLLNQNVNISPISASQIEKLSAFLPADIPFYRLQKADSKTVGETIEKTIFERQTKEAKRKNYRRFDNFSFDDYNDYSSGDYEFLSENFDERIDETEDAEIIEKSVAAINFFGSLQSANPQAVLRFAKPKVLPAPLFIDFERGAVFHLASPEGFNRNEFEAKIARKFSTQTLVLSPNVELNWETKTENNLTWRELKLPMLEWKAVYFLRGNDLILANDVDFLREILSAENTRNIESKDAPTTKLTVINLEEKENAFTEIFARLEETSAFGNFFTGNVKSLLDSISKVKKIEVRENYARNILEETIIFYINDESK